MGRATFTRSTDKTQVAAQLQGFALLVGLKDIKVSYHVAAGNLYRMDGDDEGSFFATDPNEITMKILQLAREKKFVMNFKKDIGKQG